jgi:hypothetical protein
MWRRRRPATEQGCPRLPLRQEARRSALSGAQMAEKYLEDEVVSWLRVKLGALEPGDPLLDEIAERWFAQRVPDRRIFEEGREAAKARIADLYAARYQRGEFSTQDDLATSQATMARNVS